MKKASQERKDQPTFNPNAYTLHMQKSGQSDQGVGTRSKSTKNDKG